MQERERVRCSSCHVLPRSAPQRVPEVSRSGSSAGARNAFGEQAQELALLPSCFVPPQLLTPRIVVHRSTRLHRRTLPVSPRDPLAVLQAFDFAQRDGALSFTWAWTRDGRATDYRGVRYIRRSAAG